VPPRVSSGLRCSPPRWRGQSGDRSDEGSEAQNLSRPTGLRRGVVVQASFFQGWTRPRRRWMHVRAITSQHVRAVRAKVSLKILTRDDSKDRVMLLRQMIAVWKCTLDPSESHLSGSMGGIQIPDVRTRRSTVQEYDMVIPKDRLPRLVGSLHSKQRTRPTHTGDENNIPRGVRKRCTTIQSPDIFFAVEGLIIQRIRVQRAPASTSPSKSSPPRVAPRHVGPPQDLLQVCQEERRSLGERK
jgi:hypothetical protein